MASTAAGVAVGSTVGHTLGHAITGSMFGSSSSAGGAGEAQDQGASYTSASASQATTTPGNPCELDSRAFARCLDQNNNDIGACQAFFELYKQCMQMNSSQQASSSSSSSSS